MMKKKLTQPIQKEIDRQEILNALYASDFFEYYSSMSFCDKPSDPDAGKISKEDIKILKDILAQYQAMNQNAKGTPTKLL